MPAPLAKDNQCRLGVPEILRLISPKRQELIRPVLEHPREYVLLSVRALAQKLRTDPATALRIVLAMGFSSYREFQRYLHELSIAHATSLDLVKTAANGHASVTARVQETLRQDLKNLQGVCHSMDVAQIARLAERFYDARRILVLGGDLAVSLVLFLEYHLTVLGLPVVTATTAGKVVNLVRSVNRKDLVIAISFRRGLRQTVEGLQRARANGSYCIGITDTFLSPIARTAHQSFIASTDTAPFGSSYVAAMAVLDAIISAIANHRRERTINLLKQVDKEQRTGFRWYEES